jgi:AraC family transcriptional regulator of adaptative response/methylated-DNA-[protein]-cysteine methyltransferase
MTSGQSASASQWRAIRNRSPHHVALFVVGVRTSGTFCTPACPTPAPERRREVEIFRSTHDARAAGYRDCPHCDAAGAEWLMAAGRSL